MSVQAAFQEKRHFPRKPIHTKVFLEKELHEGDLYCFSQDISSGGILIRSDHLLPLHSQVYLRFKLYPHTRPIQAIGKIVRVMRQFESNDDNEESKLGLGVEFTYLHPLDRQLIEEYTKQV